MVQIKSFVFLSIIALALAQNDQSSGCIQCRNKGRDQVCGEDGNIYTNECEAKCKKTTVACFGECPCTVNSEAAGIFPEETQKRQTEDDQADDSVQHSSSSSICPASSQSVCGQNGKTFSSKCLAENSGTVVACNGNCPCPGNSRPPVRPSLLTKKAEKRQTEDQDEEDQADDSFQHSPSSSPCPTSFQPVCGQNGKTFSNKCLADNNGTVIACNGECPCTGNTRTPVRPSLFSKNSEKRQTVDQDEEDQADDSFQHSPISSPCPTLFQPVCGQNGKTYSNKCLADNNGTVIACNGECPCTGNSRTPVRPSAFIKNSEKRQTADQDEEDQAEASFQHSPSSTPCPASYQPVCGQNGKTFSNKCLAETSGSKVQCEGECPCDTNENCHSCCGEDRDPKACQTIRPNCSGCSSK